MKNAHSYNGENGHQRRARLKARFSEKKKDQFDDYADDCALLGSLVNEHTTTVAEIGTAYSPSLLGSYACQIILRHIRALEENGHPVDEIIVTGRLCDSGDLERIGGVSALHDICSSKRGYPSTAGYHLMKIRERAARREALQLSIILAEASKDNLVTPSMLIDKIEQGRDAVGRMLSGPARREGPMVEFLRPSELRAFEPPANWNLVGDYHIQRNSVFVIGGPPGTGKSRAITFLAEAGATGQPFLGLPVHVPFRTMVLQHENGRVRLKNELEAISPESDDSILYSPPPPYGFAFSDPKFLRELRAKIEQFRPDVFVLDPWNRLARDDRNKDYQEAFEAVMSVMPVGDDCPAIGIVAHTRKTQVGERADGRALLKLLAGSYVLGSVPRSVWILQPASDDSTDDRLVSTCCKNNDGVMGDRFAWHRRNGIFAPCADFAWDEFDGASDPENSRATVTEEHMAEVFDDGKASLSVAEAKRRLEKLTGFKKTACYNALQSEGRFRGRLTEKKEAYSIGNEKVATSPAGWISGFRPSAAP